MPYSARLEKTKVNFWSPHPTPRRAVGMVKVFLTPKPRDDVEKGHLAIPRSQRPLKPGEDLKRGSEADKHEALSWQSQ